jgi:endonuclease/exonuclease/phosphatase family metal-dependent hydrolase
MKIVLMLFVAIYAAGCNGTRNDSHSAVTQLTVLSWNVQALFDGEEAGNEYDEYSSSAGWNGEKYQARLVALSGAVGTIKDHVPDVLVLIEAENARVLDDLVNDYLLKKGYQWTFFGTNPGYSLGIGIISRLPFVETKLHSINIDGVVIPRPIVEVRINTGGHPMVLFACHWKSKLGDDSELLRRAAARVLVRRLNEIQQEDPSIPVVIMGDLNENYDEFYREGAGLTALLPDDPAAALLTGHTADEQSPAAPADFLVICTNKPPVAEHFAAGTVALYSPWGTELLDGSYSYKNQWESIDHILLSPAFFDDIGWDFDSCTVVTNEPFINSAGIPARYNPRTGAGLSDHLPLLLVLKNK